MPDPGSSGTIVASTSRFDGVIDNLIGLPAGVPQFSPVIEIYTATAAEAMPPQPFAADSQAYCFVGNRIFMDCGFDAAYPNPAFFQVFLEFGFLAAGVFTPLQTGINFVLLNPAVNVLYRFTFPRWGTRYLRLRFEAGNVDIVQINYIVKGEMLAV